MRDEDNQTQSTTTQSTKTHSYGIAPALLANKVEDGSEFVLIKRGKQSEGLQVFSTGDAAETQSWLTQVIRETEPA